MTDYISRADAIEAVKQRLYQSAMNNMSTIMTADKIFADIADNRIELWLNEVPSADAVQAVQDCRNCKYGSYNDHFETWFCSHSCECNNLDLWESADAEPKWNCTANFVAEQLDRLREMTDDEKWEFFKRFFEMKGGDDE